MQSWARPKSKRGEGQKWKKGKGQKRRGRRQKKRIKKIKTEGQNEQRARPKMQT